MSDTGYSWKNVRYGRSRQASHSDHLSRWIIIAVILAIISHVVVLIAMKKMPIFFDVPDSNEMITQSVVLRNVEERDYIQPVREKDVVDMTEPIESAKNLLEELEMLEEAPDEMEIDFSPTVEEPEMLVPIESVALAGDLNSSSEDLTEGLDFSADIEDPGSTDNFLAPEAGQITIDPGKQAADEFDPDKFNKELAKGAGGDTRDGVLEGFTPLAEMTRLSQADLEKAKGMIGSDLLYDFNKAILRDSAKNSLLKVVLIIDKNPKMKCWIEGHTDLIGSEEANLEISIARAEAVKHWLVNSMKISEDRLYIRGLGMSQPIVLSGDANTQAINRRVEIKMRKNAPPEYSDKNELKVIKKPRTIKPLRNPNLPGGGNESISGTPSPLTEVPQAIPVEEDPSLIPVPPKPPKAIPVEESPLSDSSIPVPPKAILVE